MTTIETTKTTETRAAKMADRAQQAFDTAVEVLEASCTQLRHQPEIGDGEVTKAVRQLNAAFLLAMDMQEKAREAGVKRFGTSGGGELNLDAARSEIGERLARLRGAGTGDGVSGQPESGSAGCPAVDL